MVGLVMCALGAGGLLAILVLLLTMVSGVAVTSSPVTSLAMAGYSDLAGTASSLLGLARFAFGGLTAPLVGLGGADDAGPLGLVTVVATGLALTAYFTTIKRAATAAEPGSLPTPLTTSRSLRLS